MSASSERKTIPELAEELLGLGSPEQWLASLEVEGLLNPDGLNRLLDHADRLIDTDPIKARELAHLCAQTADRAQAPAALPRSDYIRAGTYGMNGDLEAELRLTRAAHDGYVALGKNLEALRTNVGLMGVLVELGRYREAFDAGQVVLDALEGKGKLDVAASPRESALLAALVHQNRGLCLEYVGRYDEALRAYASAEERYRALGETKRLGEVLDNRGGLLLLLGRGNEALAAHEAAAAIFEETGLALSRAKALNNVGEAHLRLANYARSLDAFEQARRLYDSLDAMVDKHLLLRDVADAYLELNLYSEALAAYGEANERLRQAGIEHDRARTLWGMGSALIALSDLEGAERALAEAAEKFAASGNAPMLSGVMLEQAYLLAARGDRGAASDAARRALDLVSGQERPVQRFYAHVCLADLLPDEAETHLLAAQQLVYRLALSHLRYRVNERLGHLRRLQGRNEEARVLLEAAVEEIERLRGTVPREGMRISFLRDKTAAYEDLVLLHLDRRDEEGVRQAFTVAERAKARALIELLTGVVEKVPDASADSELEKQLRGLQADLNATYSQILYRADEDEQRAPLPNLEKRAVELEREISHLRLRAAPSPDLCAAPGPPEDLLEQLPADVSLLAYHVAGDEVMVFVTAGNEIRLIRNLSSAKEVSNLSRRLSMQWDRFRASREFVDRHMETLERSVRQILSRLYAVLIAPVELLLGEVSVRTSGEINTPELVVVPHGPLHQVPFHALFDGEKYLLERFMISYAPSVGVYAICQRRGTREPRRALVVGVSDSFIPAVTHETRAVARHLPSVDVLNDQQATVAALRRLAPGRDVLHLACHGLFRSDNPMFSSLKLYDGWLTAADVARLDLSGALVTLSACESGRSEVFAGDEIIGLTRAFLSAGASTLTVSLWVVQDEVTASLMERYYERLRGGVRPAEALRAAQLAVKDERSHPFYWASFVLIGGR